MFFLNFLKVIALQIIAHKSENLRTGQTLTIDRVVPEVTLLLVEKKSLIEKNALQYAML